MKRRWIRLAQCFCLLSACLYQGCALGVDPDIQLRGRITLLSEAAIFLLQNLASSSI